MNSATAARLHEASYIAGPLENQAGLHAGVRPECLSARISDVVPVLKPPTTNTRSDRVLAPLPRLLATCETLVTFVPSSSALQDCQLGACELPLQRSAGVGAWSGEALPRMLG